MKSDRHWFPGLTSDHSGELRAFSILRGGTLKISLRTSLPATVAALLLTGTGPSASAPPPRAEKLYPQVLQTYPHDRQAFTQGLEMAGSRLYESTGGIGTSDIRFGPLSGPATLKQPLESRLFGEGITRTGATLWQLTWRDGIAIQRSAATLKEQRRVTYSSEGWGICHQPHRRRLLMSDGTSGLQVRDPSTFALLDTMEVLSEGRTVRGLNELECVGDDVYANVWPTDSIVRIDSRTGHATAHIDASSLLTPQERRDAQLLNGIAYRPETGTFLLTGKYWPKIFEVTFARPASR
ncbi:glutaminyl-peptide cyclotransferase [Streptomyces xanthophaeus]|uniref:glutaminyl-peptide cyclotransferase n=1 Tax=Streptomyces xanthophaeus TaxID=67385 RepID=UPI00399027CF